MLSVSRHHCPFLSAVNQTKLIQISIQWSGTIKHPTVLW